MTTLSSTDHMEPRDQHVTRNADVDKELPRTPLLSPTTPGGNPLPQPDPFLSPPLEPDEIGRLGPYRVLRLLGRGGMGIVYQAEDSGLGRPVAIKILKQELADQGDSWDRFLREARTLASIKHEHVVTVYHTGREGKVAYLVMELLQGCSLAEHLTIVRQPPVADILRLGRELATGLAVVHEHGLIHRDMKPANVWVETPQGRIKILDFGLARMVRDDARLTQTGVIVGTPAYMSPEQARGLEVDQRSDLFSLGCILYRLCTGLEPFRGPDTMSLLTALAVDTPDPVEKLNPAIPQGLGNLVMHLLAKKPEDRPATAREVAARLEALERSLGKPIAPSNTQKLTPSVNAVAAQGSNPWRTLRLSLLLGGGLLAGVIGGFFALQTTAGPNRATKDKAAALVGAAAAGEIVRMKWNAAGKLSSGAGRWSSRSERRPNPSNGNRRSRRTCPTCNRSPRAVGFPRVLPIPDQKQARHPLCNRRRLRREDQETVRRGGTQCALLLQETA